jgi:hypothetical protein
MNSSTWQPVPSIVGPCAEISLSLSSQDIVIATMHFSLVTGLPDLDLRIRFEGALALHWETECPGFYPSPLNMEMCTEPQWARWVFPLQKINGSELLEQFKGVYQVGGAPELSHFMLISMDDLVHVIAPNRTVAEWIPGCANVGGGQAGPETA